MSASEHTEHRQRESSANQLGLTPRRRIPACVRCRQRKVKCDGRVPTCSSCERARVACDQTASVDRAYVDQLLSRIKLLERVVKDHVPDLAIPDGDAPDASANQPPADGRGPPSPANPVPSETEGSFNRTARSGLTVAGQPAQPAPGERSEPLLDHPSVSQDQSTPATSAVGSQIGPEQPLAHDVGLLSLANVADPKYIGPSSGFTFARLIYAATAQNQGLPGSGLCSRQRSALQDVQAVQADQRPKEAPMCVSLPQIGEMYRLVDAFFNEFQHSYPFLPEDWVDQVLEKKHHLAAGHAPQPQSIRPDIDIAILFLVAALGARSLEVAMNLTLDSSNYLSSAMVHVAGLSLYDSVQGVQVMLLLVLVGMSFPEGLNSWFLTHTIIASCLDLGLQRKTPPKTTPGGLTMCDTREEDVRAGVFWSAYSLDRTLCTVLGRPLTLRDEAIDIEFPGESGTGYSSYSATTLPTPLVNQASVGSSASPAAKRARLDNTVSSPYASANFSFRFDRITAEIKLMLYRVAQVPSRFPWPTNIPQWQQEVLTSCNSLLAAAKRALTDRRAVRSRRVLPTIEIKYHQCIMLLFRPSPATPRPPVEAISHCFVSAMEILKIHADQLKFGEMANSWLTAHLVFVSGITMLYAVCVVPGVLGVSQGTGEAGSSRAQELDDGKLTAGIQACSSVLEKLGATWSVARDARRGFEELAAITRANLRSRQQQRSQQQSNNVDPSAQGPRSVDVENSTTTTTTTTFFNAPANDGGFNQTSRSDSHDVLGGQGDANLAWMSGPGGEAFDLNDFGAFDMPDFMREHLGDMTGLFDLDWMGRWD